MVMLLLEFTKVSAIDNKYLAVFSRENITLHEKYFVFMCFSQQGRFCSFLKGISLFSIFFWAAYKEIAFIWIQCNCYVAFLCMSYCPSVSLVFWVAFSIEHNSDGDLYLFFSCLVVGGKLWKTNALLSAFLFPGLVFSDANMYTVVYSCK